MYKTAKNEPMETPRIAPAAPSSGKPVVFRKYSASAIPTNSLMSDSKTCETAVGVMLERPWK